jgi:hypothetical protein
MEFVRCCCRCAQLPPLRLLYYLLARPLPDLQQQYATVNATELLLLPLTFVLPPDPGQT